IRSSPRPRCDVIQRDLGSLCWAMELLPNSLTPNIATTLLGPIAASLLLDSVTSSQSNSIGAILSHISAAEVGYQAATFYDRDLNEEERIEWGAALDTRACSGCTISGPLIFNRLCVPLMPGVRRCDQCS